MPAASPEIMSRAMSWTAEPTSPLAPAAARPGKRVGPSGEAITAAVVGLLGGALLGIVSILIRTEPSPRGDDLIYERIARNPLGVHTFPFGYRIGLPGLVHLLPFGYTTGFRLVAIAAAGGASAFAYLLMRCFSADRRVCIGLALLMCLSPPFVVVAIRNGRNTDIATVLLLMAGTYFVVRRRYLAFALTLLIGAAVREAVLFLIPLAYAVWADRLVDRRTISRLLAVALPACIAYLAIRVGLQTIGEAKVPGYGGSIVGQRLSVIGQGLSDPARELRRMFTIYGPLWIIAPLALRDLAFARRGLVLVACALASMTFALDWGRMILLAAPVFYASSAYVLSRHPRWTMAVFAALLALAIGYAIYMNDSGVQTGIVDNPLPPYPVR